MIIHKYGCVCSLTNTNELNFIRAAGAVHVLSHYSYGNETLHGRRVQPSSCTS